MSTKYFIVWILVIFQFSISEAQVTIAPPLVIVDREHPYGSFVVVNQSAQRQEISISFQYGYPVSDETGNVSMQYVDEPDSGMFSASDWVRAFPRRFILEPFREQTVRLNIRAPRQLDDGTYTARIITSSIRVNGTNDNKTDGLSAQVNFRFNQVSALMYRHGKVTTGIEIKDIYTDRDNSSFNVYASLLRTGNSPFLGSAHLRIYNERHQLVKETTQSLAVYYDLVRRFQIDNNVLKPGTYQGEITLTTKDRTDIPLNYILKIDDVTRKFTLTIR